MIDDRLQGLLDSVGKRLVKRDGHMGVTGGPGGRTGTGGTRERVRIAHAHSVVCTAIIDEIRAGVTVRGQI